MADKYNKSNSPKIHKGIPENMELIRLRKSVTRNSPIEDESKEEENGGPLGLLTHPFKESNREYNSTLNSGEPGNVDFETIDLRRYLLSKGMPDQFKKVADPIHRSRHNLTIIDESQRSVESLSLNSLDELTATEHMEVDDESSSEEFVSISSADEQWTGGEDEQEEFVSISSADEQWTGGEDEPMEE